jgi:ABC-type Na+ efflux pump permease subunit
LKTILRSVAGKRSNPSEIAAVFYKEFKTIKHQKNLLIAYTAVLVIWGILQPVSTLLSLAAGNSFVDFKEFFFYKTNFLTFSAFFLTLSVTHSSQIFMGEKASRTLNLILATPIRIRSIILAKWLFAFCFVLVLSFLVFGMEYFTFLAVTRILNIPGQLVLPDLWSVFPLLFQFLLFWGVAMWYGAFAWLKFDTQQSSNLFSILFVIPMILIEYYILEHPIPFLYVATGLLLVNVILGASAVLMNHRDRLSRVAS